MTAPPLVRFDGVSKSYDHGRSWAVRDLTMDLAAGEFLSLLGASGSGKTTSLMMLAGFEPATSGKLWLSGRDLGGLPAWRRDIGVVFQSYALFPHMTVAENVAFPLEVRKVAPAEVAQRVKRSLDLVRLAGMADRLPKQLSGGQQQRVALARALVFDPRLVLLDEPLGALDRLLRAEMQAEIRRLHRELGVAMIYVTHDQEEALSLSDRIAVFEGGRMLQIDAPNRLFDAPATPSIARFIAQAALLSGVVERDGETHRLRFSDGSSLIGAPATSVATSSIAAGTRAVAALRPDRLALSPPGVEGLAATLTDVMFHGDHWRASVSLAGGVEVVVKLDSSAASVLPARGAGVGLSVRGGPPQMWPESSF